MEISVDNPDMPHVTNMLSKMRSMDYTSISEPEPEPEIPSNYADGRALLHQAVPYMRSGFYLALRITDKLVLECHIPENLVGPVETLVTIVTGLLDTQNVQFAREADFCSAMAFKSETAAQKVIVASACLTTLLITLG